MRALPSSLRLMNQRRILERLASRPGASRAELADLAGTSRPTAGKIIDELIDAEVVEERPFANGPSGRVGRPGRLLALDSRTARFVLVRLGARRTELRAVPIAGPPDERWTIGFPTPRSEQGFLRQLRKARAALGASGAWAFALSVPGVFDERAGRSLLSPNLHWIEGVDLVQRLEALWRLPGCGVQEIRALALGYRAQHPAVRDFLLVDAGRGLGAAAVVGGQLLDGALAASGELGHTRVPGNRRPCGCGGTGCLETLVARPGLLASARRDDWASLLSALRAGSDPRWLGATLEALGTAIGGALNVLGLDRVVLTGLFDELPARTIARLADDVQRGALAARFGTVLVEVAPRWRARGLADAAFERLLVPTERWDRPCVPPAPAEDRAIRRESA